MMIVMKAMKSFRGQPHEGVAGKVKAGAEFKTYDKRAIELEEEGLAYPVFTEPFAKMDMPLLNKMEPPPENKAADTGPLDAVGGETGEENASSSSDRVRHPQRRRSRKPSDGLDL